MLLRISSLCLAFHLCLNLAFAGESHKAVLQLTPSTIEMGTFYNGEKLRIEGTVAVGSEVIVVVRGANKDEFFNRKGRVGPIWVNADRVHIRGVPSLFLCLSSRAVRSLVRPELVDDYQLDETAVMNQMHCKIQCKCTSSGQTDRCMGMEPEETYLEAIKTDLQQLKAHEGSYLTNSNAVRLGQPDNNGLSYAVEFIWPKRAPAGSYEVDVYECRHGEIIGRMSTPLNVVEVGFPARMAAWAKDNGAFYGAFAVAVAALGGFGMDFLAARLRRKRDRKMCRIEKTQGQLSPLPKCLDITDRPSSEEEDVRYPACH